MLKFTKMHGLGNDYVFIYEGEQIIENKNELAKKLSNRNFGIGSDGLIIISKSEIVDFKMQIFNSDGSLAKMCGNGIRCVGKYIWENGLSTKKNLNIETGAGIKRLHLIPNEKNEIEKVEVYMGRAEIIDVKDIILDDCKCKIYLIDVGNLHGVLFTDSDVNTCIKKYGEYIYKLFENKINVEFVKIINSYKIEMAVYERGSGITLACGTGATASYFIAHKVKSLNNNGKVILQNGELQINVNGNLLTMTGTATKVYEGVYFD